jgi:transposase-like protein
MDGVEVNGDGRLTGEGSKRTRRRWTVAEKRRIVREVERAGAVKSEVAQRHGVHVSLLARWRAEIRGKGPVAKKGHRRVRLLPVRVSKSPGAASPTVHAKMAARDGDFIEVAFPAGQRVKVRGLVDGGSLRAVLQELSRC